MKVVEKPWGREIWFGAVAGKYMGKVLIIFVNHQSSLHYHRHKEETIYVAEGVLAYIEKRGGEEVKKLVQTGEAIHIKPGTLHSLKWEQNPFSYQHKPTILFEVSTYHPEDSIRAKDYYGRRVEGDSE